MFTFSIVYSYILGECTDKLLGTCAIRWRTHKTFFFFSNSARITFGRLDGKVYPWTVEVSWLLSQLTHKKVKQMSRAHTSAAGCTIKKCVHMAGTLFFQNFNIKSI